MGEGSFGKVYKGCDLHLGSPVAIKAMKPQRLSFIKREVYILSILAGKPHIINLLNVVIDWLTEVPFLIFEFVAHEDYATLFLKLSLDGVVDYTYQLLMALHHCRCHSIMHRDIKPANVVYNPDSRRLKLIDWGTAEIYQPGKDLTCRVGTRAFRAPELLAGCVWYDFSVDMWGVGCILWQAIFGVKESMFPYGSDEVEMLRNIARVLGAEAFRCFYEKLSTKSCVKKLGSSQSAWMHSSLLHLCTCADWLGSAQSAKGKPFAMAEDNGLNPRLGACSDMGGFRLLNDILIFDPSARLLPEQAMGHEFFKTHRKAVV